MKIPWLLITAATGNGEAIRHLAAFPAAPRDDPGALAWIGHVQSKLTPEEQIVGCLDEFAPGGRRRDKSRPWLPHVLHGLRRATGTPQPRTMESFLVGEAGTRIVGCPIWCRWGASTRVFELGLTDGVITASGRTGPPPDQTPMNPTTSPIGRGTPHHFRPGAPIVVANCAVAGGVPGSISVMVLAAREGR